MKHILCITLTIMGIISAISVAAQDLSTSSEDSVVPAPIVDEPTLVKSDNRIGQSDSVPPDVLERRVDEVLRRFSDEPSLTELKRAALIFADADQKSAQDWSSAPNRAALLPVMKIAFDHDIERDETLDRYQDEPDRWGADTDRDFGIQISAQWKLDELVFSPDEVRIWAALADRASRRQAVLTMLVSYYYERRKLQLELLLDPPRTLPEMLELKVHLLELEASIDALTGGHLTRKRSTAQAGSGSVGLSITTRKSGP